MFYSIFHLILKDNSKNIDKLIINNPITNIHYINQIYNER